MIKVDKSGEPRICQGDILRDIEYIEDVTEQAGVLKVSKIIFPFAIVLTQDCDLQQDFDGKKQENNSTQDKYLISIILAPLYNIEHVYMGEHLALLNLNMRKINKKATEGTYLKQNQLQRYHYLEFEKEIQIPSSVIDFKHYFTVKTEVLLQLKEKNFVCKVSELYRENISHRFANFLARIGLPNPTEPQPST